MKLQMKFGFKKAVNGICHCYGFIIHGVLIYVFKHVVCGVPHALHCVFIGDIEPEHDRRVYMPLRYNYDKPEKPRISRVFGYLARFFILFQTEKSSREVVIS